MSVIRISINGHDYEVACDDGQEPSVKALARTLDARVRAIASADGKGAEAQMLMIAGLMLTDELQDAARALEQARHDIRNSSQSFEKNKQIELENAVTSTIHHIAERIESIAGQLERA